MKRAAMGVLISGILLCVTACPIRAAAAQSANALILGDRLNEKEMISYYQRNNADYILDQMRTEIENRYTTLYTSANVNFRTAPDTGSEVIEVLPFNTEIRGYLFQDGWYSVSVGKRKGFVCADYAASEQVGATDYGTDTNTIKSFMPYVAITCRDSRQYILQQQYAYTGDYGIRMIKNRYCAALGSAYTTNVGQYFDLILENGEQIPCILADCKADRDTDAGHRITYDGSLVEFVVDTEILPGKARYSGDVGDVRDGWNSPVAAVRIYDKNIFSE